jgi:uncharacterized membrane protein SpoIIM required for sporulation
VGTAPPPSAPSQRSLAGFTAARDDDWRELEALVRTAGGRTDRLGPDGVLRLGGLYRATAADLSEARRRFPGDPLVARLQGLVVSARGLVYRTEGRRTGVGAFFRREYWRLIAERPLPLLIAAVLLFAPAALGATWAVNDAPAAAGLVPEEYRAISEPRANENSELRELSAEERAQFSSEIFTNNIRVSFMAFAGGIAAGILTALLLAYNGILLGVIGGLAQAGGNGASFAELVIPHGVLELSLIVVTAAAGMRIGWALIDPGRRTRGRALADEARTAVMIVLGSVTWFVLAGLVEGFFTPQQAGLGAAIAVGVGLAAVYWALVAWRGKPSTKPVASELT